MRSARWVATYIVVTVVGGLAAGVLFLGPKLEDFTNGYQAVPLSAATEFGFVERDEPKNGRELFPQPVGQFDTARDLPSWHNNTELRHYTVGGERQGDYDAIGLWAHQGSTPSEATIAVLEVVVANFESEQPDWHYLCDGFKLRKKTSLAAFLDDWPVDSDLPTAIGDYRFVTFWRDDMRLLCVRVQ